MKKIGKLRHELRTENMISSESSTYQIIEVVNALVDAHNELLETHTVKEPIGKYSKDTGHLVICSSQSGSPFECHICNPSHTVKEPKRTIWVEEAAYNRGYVTGRTDCEKSHTVASPSNSEKEEHKHRMEDTPLNSEYCLDCGVVFGKKEEVKEEPTTPEEPKFGAFVIYEEDGFMTLERYGYFKMAKQDEESLKELLGYLKQYFEPTTPEKKCGYPNSSCECIGECNCVLCRRRENSIKHSCGRV